MNTAENTFSEKLKHAYIIKSNFELFMKCKDRVSAKSSWVTG